MFTLNIDTDNAAFQDGDGNAEIARILRDLAERFDISGRTTDNGTVRDTNGNTVGAYVVDMADGIGAIDCANCGHVTVLTDAIRSMR